MLPKIKQYNNACEETLIKEKCRWWWRLFLGNVRDHWEKLGYKV